MFTINATRTGLWSNTGLRGERPAIDSLQHGMAAFNQQPCLKMGGVRGTHEKRWIQGLSGDILEKVTTLKTKKEDGNKLLNIC